MRLSATRRPAACRGRDRPLPSARSQARKHFVQALSDCPHRAPACPLRPSRRSSLLVRTVRTARTRTRVANPRRTAVKNPRANPRANPHYGEDLRHWRRRRWRRRRKHGGLKPAGQRCRVAAAAAGAAARSCGTSPRPSSPRAGRRSNRRTARTQAEDEGDAHGGASRIPPRICSKIERTSGGMSWALSRTRSIISDLERPHRHADGNREDRSDDRADGARHQADDARRRRR